MIRFFRSTKHHSNWWSDRKIDWAKQYQNWEHPHRAIIVKALKSFNWTSLIEVGCGGGANLMAILHSGFTNKQLGGIDVNADALEAARKVMPGGLFKQGSVEDMMMSDDATDVVLSDMCLIYIGPFKIDAALKEIFRITRNHVVFFELHSTNPLKRLWLKIRSGYNAYNWSKLLRKHGCYDIIKYKMPPGAWDNGEPQKTFAYLFIARVPK